MKDGIILTILVIVWTVIKLIFKLIWVIVKILASLFIFFGLYIPLFYGVFGIVLLAATDFVLGVVGTDQVLYFLGFGLSCLAALIISIRNLIVRPFSAIFAPFLEYRDEIKKAKDDLSGKKDDEQNGEQTPNGQPDPAYYNRQPYPYPGYPQPDYMRNGYPQQPYSYGYPYNGDPRAAYPQGDPYAGGYPNDGYAPDGYAGANGAPYYAQTPHPPYYSDRRAPAPDPYGGQGRQPAYPDPAPSSVRAPMPERPLIYYSKRRPGVLVKEYSDRFELFEESEGGRRYIGTEYKDE